MFKKLENPYPITSQLNKQISIIAKNPSLTRKLDKYSIFETILTIVIFAIFLIISVRIAGYLDQIKINFMVGIIFMLTMFASFGPSYCLTKLILRGIFKIFNPHLDSRLLDIYYFKMNDSDYIYSLKNIKFDSNKFLRIWARRLTIIWVIGSILSSIFIILKIL